MSRADPAVADAANKTLRILIVSEHASAEFGGEAALPLHYYRVLRRRGFAVWLITHARTRGELRALFGDDPHIEYVEDTWLHKAMWQIGRRLPARISYFTAGFVSRFAVQLQQRRMARRLVRDERIDVIHQPMPVSPREPSMIYGFGVPVLIGPMNGGMEFPPAFKGQRSVAEAALLALGRWSAACLNALMPGKRRAAALLVANRRTAVALPKGVSSHVVELVENGVDLTVWRPPAQRAVQNTTAPATFVFLGRLVDWKAVDLLVEAFAVAAATAPIRLLIIGDGGERGPLEALAGRMDVLADAIGAPGKISFLGWLPQPACAAELGKADVLVLPSLLECGGAVVLEAMAMGKPVIATAWGGPLDYLDASCGVLVEPAGRDSLVRGFAQAMAALALDPRRRVEMGECGRERVLASYDWEVKVDTVLALYASLVPAARPARG